MVKLSSSGRHARSTCNFRHNAPRGVNPNNYSRPAAYHAGVLQDIATVEEASSTIENQKIAHWSPACWWAAIMLDRIKKNGKFYQPSASISTVISLGFALAHSFTP